MPVLSRRWWCEVYVTHLQSLYGAHTKYSRYKKWCSKLRQNFQMCPFHIGKQCTNRWFVSFETLQEHVEDTYTLRKNWTKLVLNGRYLQEKLRCNLQSELVCWRHHHETQQDYYSCTRVLQMWFTNWWLISRNNTSLCKVVLYLNAWTLDTSNPQMLWIEIHWFNLSFYLNNQHNR